MATAYQLIGNLNNSLDSFTSKSDVQVFLDTLSADDQSKLIDLIYLGRSHINSNKIEKEYLPLSITRNEHISKDDYSEIIYQKKTSISQYLNKVLECAKNSNIDLNQI